MRSTHAEGGREERQHLLVGRPEDGERLRARRALVRQRPAASASQFEVSITAMAGLSPRWTGSSACG